MSDIRTERAQEIEFAPGTVGGVVAKPYFQEFKPVIVNPSCIAIQILATFGIATSNFTHRKRSFHWFLTYNGMSAILEEGY